MEHIRLRFGGGGETQLHPAALLLLLIGIVLVLVLLRKYAIVALLPIAILIPLGQEVVIGPIHFMMFRILVLFGWIRLVYCQYSTIPDTSRNRTSPMDTALLRWVLVSAVMFSLLWLEWGAVIHSLGILYDGIGIYFLLRFLIRDQSDVNRTIKVFAVICATAAVFMLVEQMTGRNLFSVFGTVKDFTAVRDGRLRSQGPFAHPILTGTFGATLVPLFVGLWWQSPRSKPFAALGFISAIVMIITSASSTPLLALMAGIGALFFWGLRNYMRPLRWAVVLALVMLHLIMKAPVWALIARTDVVGGSSGYHRYELVNQLITRFGEWWLVGTKSTEQWGWNIGDTANQYVDGGVMGGLLTLVLFIAIIWQGFRSLGRARKAIKGDRRAQLLVWALGAALFSHAVAFMGISYFDQTIFGWYALLAMIAALSTQAFAAVQTSKIQQPVIHPMQNMPAHLGTNNVGTRVAAPRWHSGANIV